MAIEINIETENVSNFMSRFFAEYCMSIRGPLFQDPNQYLSETTFRTLKRKIIQFCEPPAGINSWTYQRCRSERSSHNYNWKSFYRCFGIFLRESVLRYGKSITQGEFWRSINNSTEISLFNKDTLEDVIKLNDGYNHTLFYNAFREFHDEDIHYTRPNDGVQNDYVGHMIKIAILPFNLNPFNYEICQREYLRNNLGNYIFNAPQVSLSRHPATKELLTKKISDFFVYYEDLKKFPLDIQIDRLENFYGISRQNVWMYEWLQQASNNNGNAPTTTNLTPEQQQEKSQRLRNNSIKQSRILLRLYGEQDIRYQTIQAFDFLGILFKDIFNDVNHNHRITDDITLSLNNGTTITIRNKRFLNISNQDVDSLLVSEKVSVSINRVNYEDLDNPWYTGRNWHILNYTGSELNRLAADANHHCYIVIPADKKISYFCTDFANQNKIIPPPLQGITAFKVYKIDPIVLQNADTLHFVLNNGEEFHIEVEDPTYLRLHQKTDRSTVIGPTKFIFQQKSHKIGIGKIEFSIKTLDDIENVNYDDIINSLKAAYIADNSLNDNAISVQIQENTDNGIEYLCLTNNTSSILEFEEKFLLNTQLKLPSITIFPRDVEIWVAKKSTNPSDYFCPFINGKVDNLSGSWANWHSDNCRIYDGGNEWLNSGANVSFANRAIYLHAPYLTTRASGVNNWDDSRSIPMYNGVFGSLIPKNALYFFKWLENDSVCKAEVIRITTHATYGKTIRDAYRDLDINGAGVLFGWEYMHSYFVNQYQEATDYTGPRVPRSEGFYALSDDDRFDILSNKISNGFYLLNKFYKLLEQYADLFQQDPSLENQCKACNTTAEMQKIIDDRLIRLDPNYNSNRIQNVINQIYDVIHQCINEGTISSNVIYGIPISKEIFTQASSDEYVRERVLYYLCRRYNSWIKNETRMDFVYKDVFKPNENEDFDLNARKHEIFMHSLTKEFLQTVFDNI